MWVPYHWSMGTDLDTKLFVQLGTAMRLARLNHRPPLTLKDVGYSPKAPRSWSHAHLSKVERGVEAPKQDLVQWYEKVTEVTPGYLLDLWSAAMGQDDASLAAMSVDDFFVSERIEMHGLFNLPHPEVHLVVDLLATKPSATSHALLMDGEWSNLPAKTKKGPAILSGAESAEVEWSTSSASSVRFHFGREFMPGDWHRLRIAETTPDFSELKRHLTLSSRRSESRDAIVTLTLPNGVRPKLCVIDGMMSEEVNALFGDPSASAAKRLSSLQPLEVDSGGSARVRFRGILPGLRYGIGWYD